LPPEIESTFPFDDPFTFGVSVSDDPLRFKGPLTPNGMESPLLGVSYFFFLSEAGPNDVTFFIPKIPFCFPGVIFA